MSQENYFIGIDVGTGSARAALVSSVGAIVAESTYTTTTWKDETDPNIFEQSTRQIWECISKACKDILARSGIDSQQVKGIGFDATCSLAVTASRGDAVSVTCGVSPSSDLDGSEYMRDVILWADHRASSEATFINSLGSPVLTYVGGSVSVAMQIPKILWLKNNMPSPVFADCNFFDLPDWLTWRATGDESRSMCSLGCKFNYVPSGDGKLRGKEGWNPEFFNSIGLESFVRNDFSQISTSTILSAGSPVGAGLSALAASDLGLQVGTAVGSGVIDAYAGWIGTIAAPLVLPAVTAGSTVSMKNAVTLEESKHRLAAIAGTSTCHIVQSKEPIFVKNVWGPYEDAIFPGYCLSEAGQSSTGLLIDHMISSHPASSKLFDLAQRRSLNHFVILEEILLNLVQEKKVTLGELTKGIFIYPDLHGNRSPLADPLLRGMHTGLSLDTSLTSLALTYYATLEAIALQTRHIIEALNSPPDSSLTSTILLGSASASSHHQITSIFLSGGLVKNTLLMQLLADACEMPIVLPFSSSASVVLGAAMLGAAAYAMPGDGVQREGGEGLWEIMVRMMKSGSTILPAAGERTKKLLQVKYEIFRECIELQHKWRRMIDQALVV